MFYFTRSYSIVVNLDVPGADNLVGGCRGRIKIMVAKFFGSKSLRWNLLRTLASSKSLCHTVKGRAKVETLLRLESFDESKTKRDPVIKCEWLKFIKLFSYSPCYSWLPLILLRNIPFWLKFANISRINNILLLKNFRKNEYETSKLDRNWFR